ncbi:MAG: nucleotidyl transferase AbiEii/AbiGii toxin family protein [Bacilli bacterium]
MRLEDEYSGFNVNLKAEFDGVKTNLLIDITTGDVITYKEVEFKYYTLFDDEAINIMTYNYETIIAEKFETIIFRNIDNTRMKDYYDLYMFVNLKWSEINKDILRKAIINTSKKRNTENYIEDANSYIEMIQEDDKLKSLWNSYVSNYEYAKDITFEDTIKAIKVINELVVPSIVN